MPLTEFELLVLEMRTTQKKYFKKRDPVDLAQSKELEHRVDAHLKHRKHDDSMVPNLFDKERP